MARRNVDLLFRINWSLNLDAGLGGATNKHHGKGELQIFLPTKRLFNSR